MRHLLLIALLATSAAFAAEGAPDPAAMAAAMAKMSTTGAEHAALAKAVGEWDVKSTMWMPGAPAMTFDDHATFTVVLGGKWIRQDYAGVRMDKPYTGLGLSGYDTIAQRYVASWHDDFSTASMELTGTSGDGGKTITYASEMPFCPMTGGPLAVRQVLTFDSADRMTFTMFNTPKGGTEAKAMELVYTRAKAK
jgi:hypothetical protein